MNLSTSRTIVFDIDGTLFNFKKFDTDFVRNQLFKSKKTVLVLDKILWFMNSLDFFENSMSMLKIRVWIYSILSGCSYKLALELYMNAYQKALKSELEGAFEDIHNLARNCGFNLITISNNIFAKEVVEASYDVECIVPKDHFISRVTMYKKLHTKYNIAYVVGNNYMDDIRPASKLDSVKSIYVGRSILRRFFKANHYIDTITEISKIIV